MPGPIAKRSTERRRRNKVPGETIVQVVGAVAVPPCPEDLHEVARAWYESLAKSGESQFYEPSDWAAALYVASAMSENLNGTRFSAQLFGVVWGAMNDMLTTEASRRKVKLEVERALTEAPEEDRPTAMDEYRKRLAQ